MAVIKRIIFSIGGFIFILGVGYILVSYYSVIFAKTVAGELTAVERLLSSQVTVMNNSQPMDAQAFSVAIAVRNKQTGEITTASSEDRQWAAARVGQCAEVRVFPYPPWNLQKAGTYFNARLEKLFDCSP